MSIREKPSRSEQQTRFQDLFRKFDQCFSGTKPQEDIAQEIVRYSTEETYDCLSVLRALDKGYQALNQGNQNGAVIIEGVEKYFSDAQINQKILLPLDQKHEKAIEECNKLLDSLAANRSKATLRPPTINDFIVTLTRLFLNPPPEINEVVMTTIAKREELKTHPHYVPAKTAYQNLSKDLVRRINLDISDPSRMKTAEYAITKALEAAQYSNSGIPDISTTPHGGITLKELIDFSLDGTNIGEFGQKVMNYLSSLPRGDFFWQRFAQGAFFNYPLGDLNVDPKKFFAHPELSEKIFLFQQWLAEKLILPVFDETALDADFDRQFTTLISHLDIHAFNELTATLYMGTGRASVIRYMFHPEISLMDHCASCPIIVLAAIEATRDDGFMAGRKSADIGAVSHHFLVNHITDIQKSLDVRFFRNKRIPILVEAFRAGVSVDYTEMHTEEFIEDMKRFLGTNFMERLNVRQTELEQVTTDIWKDTSDNPKIAYWPHPGAAHEISFSLGSLPEIMGFRSIIFTVHEERGQPVEFLLHTKDKNISAIGNLGPDGRINSISVNIEGKYPGLLKLLEHISVVTFHDLLLREQIIKTRALRDQTPKPSIPMEQGEIREGAAPRKSRRHRKRIPRGLIYADTPARDRKPIQTDALREGIDQTLKPFTPRPVDMYKRFIEGGRRYHELVQQLSQPVTDRAIILEQLTQVREKLERPSPAKLAALPNLPAKFQPITVQDPVTSETYVLETWVIAHISPKPTPEERSSPAKMYGKYYKEGSAIGFWDYLKTWIVESETTATID